VFEQLGLGQLGLQTKVERLDGLHGWKASSGAACSYSAFVALPDFERHQVAKIWERLRVLSKKAAIARQDRREIQ
jgi:hypothetical protein